MTIGVKVVWPCTTDVANDRLMLLIIESWTCYSFGSKEKKSHFYILNRSEQSSLMSEQSSLVFSSHILVYVPMEL